MATGPVVPPISVTPPEQCASTQGAVPRQTTVTWLKGVAIALGLVQGTFWTWRIDIEEPLLAALVVGAFLTVGVARLGWRFPLLVGALLVVLAGLLVLPFLMAFGLSEEPWGLRDTSVVSLGCGAPLLSGVLLFSAGLIERRSRPQRPTSACPVCGFTGIIFDASFVPHCGNCSARLTDARGASAPDRSTAALP